MAYGWYNCQGRYCMKEQKVLTALLYHSLNRNTPGRIKEASFHGWCSLSLTLFITVSWGRVTAVNQMAGPFTHEPFICLESLSGGIFTDGHRIPNRWAHFFRGSAERLHISEGKGIPVKRHCPLMARTLRKEARAQGWQDIYRLGPLGGKEQGWNCEGMQRAKNPQYLYFCSSLRTVFLLHSYSEKANSCMKIYFSIVAIRAMLILHRYWCRRCYKEKHLYPICIIQMC